MPGPGRPFQRGQVANPNGRPKLAIPKKEQAKIIADVKQAARELTPAALDTLSKAMTAERAPWAARISAATAILDRGWGKPVQTIAGDSDAPIEVRMTRLLDVTNCSIEQLDALREALASTVTRLDAPVIEGDASDGE